MLVESGYNLKQLLIKVREESAREGLHLKPSTTKIMTTEEIHSFKKDNEYREIVKAFAYLGSVIHHNGDCSQEIRRSLRLGQKGSNGRIKRNHQEQRCVNGDQC